MVKELVTVMESVVAAGHVEGLAEAVIMTVDGVREGHAEGVLLATDVTVIVLTTEQPVPPLQILWSKRKSKLKLQRAMKRWS
jgi:hypothetical protein